MLRTSSQVMLLVMFRPHLKTGVLDTHSISNPRYALLKWSKEGRREGKKKRRKEGRKETIIKSYEDLAPQLTLYVTKVI